MIRFHIFSPLDNFYVYVSKPLNRLITITIIPVKNFKMQEMFKYMLNYNQDEVLNELSRLCEVSYNDWIKGKDRTRVMDSIASIFDSNPQQSIAFLQICPDIHFFRACDVLETVADRLGSSFFNEVLSIANRRKLFDAMIDIMPARQIASSEI